MSDWKNKGFTEMFRVAFKMTFDRLSREEKAFQTFQSLDGGHSMSERELMAETA